MKLKEELCGPNKQQECNLREIKIVKDRCNDTQRQNIIAVSEESSLTLHREINLC